MADTGEMPHILVVDDSRVVRKLLVQHLKGHYQIREESDGEAAWQTLIVDHAIRAVVSDLQMPKLDGYGLLERVRTSKLRRLKELPFVLVSGEESEEDKLKAKALGASDFLTKGTDTTEILRCLAGLLSLTQSKINFPVQEDMALQDPVTGLYSRKHLEQHAALALSQAVRHGGDVSYMVLGFDGFDELCQRLGMQVGEEISVRFAKMLAGKMRHEDTLGDYGLGQFAVVSPGTAAVSCATFAERVRQAVEMAKLNIRGTSVSLTVSIGLASLANDKTESAAALLDLAGGRMHVAMGDGGNRIEAGGILPAARPITINQALELLSVNRLEQVVPHLPTLAERLLPLLGLMDRELGLALPLAEIERRVSERKQKT